MMTAHRVDFGPAGAAYFAYILDGSGRLERASGSSHGDADPRKLAADDAIFVPAGEAWTLAAGAQGLEILEFAVSPRRNPDRIQTPQIVS